jgi:hypothetical protein
MVLVPSEAVLQRPIPLVNLERLFSLVFCLQAALLEKVPQCPSSRRALFKDIAEKIDLEISYFSCFLDNNRLPLTPW